MALKRLALSRQSGVRFGALALGFTMTLCLGAASHAAVTSPCDPQYMDALEGRAYLEAQREIMQNQNLIFKADSILSYVCFDAFAGHASSNVGDIFSNGNQPMAGSMDSVVINSMTAYINNNFNHSLLGGRGQYLGLADTPPAVNGGARDY